MLEMVEKNTIVPRKCTSQSKTGEIKESCAGAGVCSSCGTGTVEVSQAQLGNLNVTSCWESSFTKKSFLSEKGS